MQEQSKLVSLLETFLNIGSGFVLSLVTWQILASYLGIPMPLGTNVFITSIFTCVSVCRSYLWRTFCAHGLHLSLANWVGRIF